MEDSIFFILLGLALLILIVIPVQWVMQYYFGFPGLIISSLALSLVGAFSGYYLYFWGKSHNPTGYTTTPAEEYSILFTAFFVCLIITVISGIGVFSLVQYHKTGLLNKLLFFSWLALVLGGPALYIGIKAFKSFLAEKEQKENFIRSSIKIFHYNEFPLAIDELKFVNTANGREARIPIHSSFEFRWEGEKKKEAKEEKEGELAGGREHSKAASRSRIRPSELLAFDQTEKIPIGADEFYMSWYSFVEDKYYSDRFPFPSDKFTTRKWADGSETMEGIELLIKPEAQVALFGSSHTWFYSYTPADTKPIDEEEKTKKLALLRAKNMPAASLEDLKGILKEIRESGRLEKRVKMEKQKFLWQLSIDAPEEISHIGITDFQYLQYDASHRSLSTATEKSLPSKITIRFKNTASGQQFRLYFSLQKEKLLKAVEALSGGSKQVPVEFLITVKNFDKNAVEWLIIADEKTLVFEDWALNIVK